jgi:hypothetical protein
MSVTQKSARKKKRMGRPRTTGPQRSIRLPVEMWAAIDDWSTRQEDVLTRSESVRQLLAIALELVSAGKTRRKRP